MLIPDFNRVLL